MSEFCSRWGVGESGKDDFFGPLVIASVCVNDADVSKLAGVADSNKLQGVAYIALDKAIRSVCEHSVVVIGPEQYNVLHETTKNLSEILAWGRARTIETLRAKEHISHPDLLGSHQFEEDHRIAVAAASIVARAEFIRCLDALGQDLGVRLPRGANQNAIDVGAEIVSRLGKSSLRKIAKVHFRTVQDVLRLARSGQRRQP